MYIFDKSLHFFSSLTAINSSTIKPIVPQYSETNVMHILFTSLRIKGLWMFRASLAHPQKAQARNMPSVIV
jgi:hypothetical protein